MKSTNPAIAVGSAALMAVRPGTLPGEYTVALSQLAIDGRMVSVASSSVVAAPSFINKIQEKTRAKDQAPDAVSGPRVYIPERMEVRFTLTALPVPSAGTPSASINVHAPDARAGKPTTTPLPPPEGTPSFRGLSLGMTSRQTRALAAQNGGATDTQQRNGLLLGLSYRDAQFEYVIEFNDQDKIRYVQIRSIDKSAKAVGPRKGPLYDAALSAFGPPAASTATRLDWKASGQGHIRYEYTPEDLWPAYVSLSDHP